MSEKYYVCSESELEGLKNAAFAYWDMINNGRTDNSEEEDFNRLDEAKAACRARPVPEWAEEFAGSVSNDGYKDDEHFSIHRRIERIKR